ncbi:uncharacterized protein LOC132720929 [Ruditapes philippinarum]|uniref:uncharacterized protein LOC132720929 n=1 Tax=Ruditapes philippinarum TaxID=129788 RepID=UPI00295B8EB6|nr:uncharacterized protein LOC132720929 [Ruditapes philippinarum]
MFSQMLFKFHSMKILGLSEKLFSRGYSTLNSTKSSVQSVLFNQKCCSDNVHLGPVKSMNYIENSVLNKGFHTSSQSRANYRVYYRPSALKRMRKHGLEKRLSQPSQREILFRRILKGRKNMTTFDRFMNDLPDHFLKPKGKRVELTDPKRGYKSIIKKKDKFIFKEI